MTEGSGGVAFVFAGVSGSGKSTISRWLEAQGLGLVSISHTTRARRGKELDDKDYHFVSIEHFEKLVAEGDMLEHANVHGSLYGTSASWVNDALARGENVFLDIDVQGARLVRDRLCRVATLFILPPSFEVLKKRLMSRKREGEKEIDSRIRHGLHELLALNEFDYVLVNADLDKACAQAATVVADVTGKKPGAASALRSGSQQKLVCEWLKFAADGLK